MDLFTILFYQPIYNLLIVFYRLFSENLGLSIIMIALISRLITLPLAFRQMKMMKSNKAFNDKVNEVKKKYKDNKEKQQQELMKVQSEYLPGQLAGCLPLILQFILLININNVISNLIHEGAAGFAKVAYSFVPVFQQGYNINTNFFGIDLNQSASHFEWTNAAIIPYIAIIILVGITQYLSMKTITGLQNAPAKTVKKDEPQQEKGKSKEKSADDFSEILQNSTKQTMFLFPFMIMVTSFSFPAGLSIYWVAQSTFVIIQQVFIGKVTKKNDSSNSIVPELVDTAENVKDKEQSQAESNKQKKKKKRRR